MSPEPETRNKARVKELEEELAQDDYREMVKKFAQETQVTFPPMGSLCDSDQRKGTGKVDIRLPDVGTSNSHGARPVH